MTEFDPYLQWLGIRTADTSINHYRLLGLELYEADPHIISMAADRQMEHVRTFQTGTHGEASQRLLSELAVARRCLLTARQKSAYDQRLRADLNSAPATQVVVPVVDPLLPPSRKSTLPANVVDAEPPTIPVAFRSVDTKKVSSFADPDLATQSEDVRRRKRKRRDRNELIWSLGAWVAGAVAALGVGAYIVTSGIIPGVGLGQNAEASSTTKNAETPDLPPHPIHEKETSDSAAILAQGTPRDVASDTSVLPGLATLDLAADNHSADAKIVNVTAPDGFKSVDDLKSYPRPNAECVALITETSSYIAKGMFRKLAPSTSQNGGNRDFEIIAQPNGLLIGVVVSQAQDGCLKSVRPVFVNQQGAQVEQGAGQPTTEKLILARPGYAVGDLAITATDPIAGLQVIFMRINPDGLDAIDRYASDWIGTNIATLVTHENAAGRPIVGLHGRFVFRSNISSLGIIAVDETMLANTESPETMLENQPPLVAEAGGLMAAANPLELKKSEPPSKKEMDWVGQELKSLYADRFRNAKSKQELRTIAQVMLKDASTSTEMPVQHYVLLTQVVETAAKSGDAKTAMKAVNELDRHFNIDFFEFSKNIIDIAAENVSADSADNFKQSLDGLIEQHVLSQEYDAADWFAKRGVKLAKLVRNSSAIKFYQRQQWRVRELERLSESNADAETMLNVTPIDPAANLIHGDYLFVVESKLSDALECWSRSGQPELEEIAKLESAVRTGPEDPAGWVKLGTAWASLSNSNRSLRDFAGLNQARQSFEFAADRSQGLERERNLQKARNVQAIIDE